MVAQVENVLVGENCREAGSPLVTHTGDLQKGVRPWPRAAVREQAPIHAVSLNIISCCISGFHSTDEVTEISREGCCGLNVSPKVHRLDTF